MWGQNVPTLFPVMIGMMQVTVTAEQLSTSEIKMRRLCVECKVLGISGLRKLRAVKGEHVKLVMG